MEKVIIAIVVVAVLCPIVATAQIGGSINPYEKALLDLYYLATNASINGALIINSTISTGKLDFAVVPFGDWTNHLQEFSDHTVDFTNHVTDFNNHTNEASAHHERFANSDETDPIYTNWLATNTYLKFPVEGGLLMPEAGWTSPTLSDTTTWYQVSLWTNEPYSMGVVYGQSNLTIDIPASRTASVDVIASISSDIANAPVIDVEYAFFINGSRTHSDVPTRGIVRSHSGNDTFGSITITEPHLLVDGDTIDLRIRKYDSNNNDVEFVAGTLSVRGSLIE